MYSLRSDTLVFTQVKQVKQETLAYPVWQSRRQSFLVYRPANKYTLKSNQHIS